MLALNLRKSEGSVFDKEPQEIHRAKTTLLFCGPGQKTAPTCSRDLLSPTGITSGNGSTTGPTSATF